MHNPKWAAVDRYFEEHLVREDAALEAALAATRSAGLPPINVAANHGQAVDDAGVDGGRPPHPRDRHARRLLDHLDGARLAAGRPPDHAGDRSAPRRVARANIAAAGLSTLVDIRLGPALDTLPTLADDGPFDLIFIDADKANNAAYLDWALKLSRPGSAIIVDNVVRGGAVADAASRDASVIGARKVTEAIAAEPRLTATAIQTVGAKGYDGFLLALVTG